MTWHYRISGHFYPLFTGSATLNSFVANSSSLLGLLNTQVTKGVCQLLALQGEDCQQLDNVILDEDGNLVLYMRE